MESKKVLSDNTIIWRYMTLESFISLISNSSLSFCRYDKLKSIDPYECSLSKYELEQDDFRFKVIEKIGNMTGNNLLTNSKLIRKINNKIIDEEDKAIFINCWNMNYYESVAMWDSFTSSKTGIAIKTTLGDLRKSLLTEYNLSFSPVEYIDLNNYKGSTYKVLRKTKYFEHENELRVYFHYVNERKFELEEFEVENKKELHNIMKINNPERIEVSVNLNELISEVIISPKADAWFINLVNKLLEDYNFDFIVKESDIKSQNIKINNSKYDLIDEIEEVKRFIDSSSFGEPFQSAIYRMNYDESSGKIIGCYPSNFEYDKIPTPYIELSWEEWQIWLSNSENCKVDIESNKFIFDNSYNIV